MTYLAWGIKVEKGQPTLLLKDLFCIALCFLNLSYFTKLVQTYFKRFIVKGSAQIKHFGWTENVLIFPGVLETGQDSALETILLEAGRNEQSLNLRNVFQVYVKITLKECVMIQVMYINGKKYVTGM